MSPARRHVSGAGLILPRSGTQAAVVESRSRTALLARLAGAAGMLLLTGVLFWLLTDEDFQVTPASVAVEGLAWADEASVREHLAGLDRAPNVFRVRTSEIVERLRELPVVASARATVTLPSSVTIHVTERSPLFAWSDRTTTALVDRDGVLFATLDAAAVPAGLPLIEDGRLVDEPWHVGDQLPADELAVMRQLLALTPASLGSHAEELMVRVDAAAGYVLSSDSWQAVFGHYTPTLQPASMLPRQVQCLQWLLAEYEERLERVMLAVSEGTCGAFSEVRRRG